MPVRRQTIFQLLQTLLKLKSNMVRQINMPACASPGISCLQLIIWFYRAIGTSIGKDCCIVGGYSAEPDSFTIGDGCVLEAYSAASNHTSEYGGVAHTKPVSQGLVQHNRTTR